MKKIDSLRYHLLKGSLKMISFLPMDALYLLSSSAAWILRSVVKYRRKMVDDNIRKAFPTVDDRQRKEWSRQFYRHLCDTFIEAVKLLGISDKEVDRRVKVYGTEIVEKAIAEGHSVVVFLGHYGNWEWVTAVSRHFSDNVSMVQIYHPLRDKAFDRLMLDIRSRFGSESIPMANTFRRLVELERGGGKFVAGFISDQRPMNKHTGSWTKFLGNDTDYIIGGEIIGDRLKCRYIYLDVEPKERGHYDLTFKEIMPMEDGGEYPYTRAYLKMLENTIKRNPPYWLWSHNRFKHKHDD